MPGCRALGFVVRSCAGPNRMCRVWDGSAFVGMHAGMGETPEWCVSVAVCSLPEAMWRPRDAVRERVFEGCLGYRSFGVWRLFLRQLRKRSFHLAKVDIRVVGRQFGVK